MGFPALIDNSIFILFHLPQETVFEEIILHGFGHKRASTSIPGHQWFAAYSSRRQIEAMLSDQQCIHQWQRVYGQVNLLHNIEGRPILQKLKHPPPPLDEVHPEFFSTYDESKYGEQLRQDLDLSHLDTQVQEKNYALVKKYWSVFDKKGVYVPVKNYECFINTVDSLPIAIKKFLYGPREIPIMCECIAALEKVGHIRQIFDSRWLFKALHSGCKAPSRARTRHCQVHMEVLRQLHSPQLYYQNNCLP
jgi:hypothetical protein